METAIKIRKDLTGMQLGQLTVLYLSDRKAKSSYYYCCQCECGKIKDILRGSLTSGDSKSCGCLQKKKVTTHGYCKHPLYQVFDGMKSRCYNPKKKNYHNYGGRGVTICDECSIRRPSQTVVTQVRA